MSSSIVTGDCNLFFQLHHRQSARFCDRNEWLIRSAQTLPERLSGPHWVCEGRGEKAIGVATWAQESANQEMGSGKRELNGDTKPLWWHLTPVAWELMWLCHCEGKDFSRMWSKEQGIHCFPGDRNRQKDGDTVFFFSYFCISPIYILDFSPPALVLELVEHL